MKKLSVIILVLLLVVGTGISVQADEYQERFKMFEQNVEEPDLIYDVFPAVMSPNYSRSEIIKAEEDRGSVIQAEDEESIVFSNESEFLDHLYYYEFDGNELKGGMAQSLPIEEVAHSGLAGEYFHVLRKNAQNMIKGTYLMEELNTEIEREIGNGSLSNQIVNERIDLMSFGRSRDLRAGVSIKTIDELAFAVVWGEE